VFLHILQDCCGSVWIIILERSPDVEDTARIIEINEVRGFSVMLEASTACIGNGRTVHSLGRKCTEVTKEVEV
jgi:hypothetical protein